jgi:hypothetical protein
MARHDPRLVIIGVDIHGAVFLEVNKPQPVVLYELMKGWLTRSSGMHTLKHWFSRLLMGGISFLMGREQPHHRVQTKPFGSGQLQRMPPAYWI